MPGRFLVKRTRVTQDEHTSIGSPILLQRIIVHVEAFCFLFHTHSEFSVFHG